MGQAATPFHTGEQKAQAHAGAHDVASWAADFIRPFMPDQHRAFYTQLPFLVLAGADEAGQHWVTLLDGSDDFINIPNDRTLNLKAAIDKQDPLIKAFTRGTDVGVLGIDLATRRRNRVSGHIKANQGGYKIDVRQSFGNCPQYIQERVWRRTAQTKAGQGVRTRKLNDAQIKRVGKADTMFIGTGYKGPDGHPSDGFDASHRGGSAGFVAVKSPTHLRIPDYPGNNFFNTIGNLLENPRIGLVFVDFETGGLLHVSGHASIDWDASDSHDPDARRIIDVEIDAVLDRPAALSLRWARDDTDIRDLAVTRKVEEAEDITSIYLADPNAAALEPFAAGQHLPIELDVPGETGLVRRSYSLSGSPYAQQYRLSVKREAHGKASRFIHDLLKVGDHVRTRKPSGTFMIPCSDCPLVLASAGVGLTPMLSALHTAANEDTLRPVWFVHGTRNSQSHALKQEVADLTRGKPHLQSVTLHSQPLGSDQLGQDYDAIGRVTAQTLLDLNAGQDAHYMLCGPAKFLSDVRSGLEAAGVSAARIHVETFGPAS